MSISNLYSSGSKKWQKLNINELDSRKLITSDINDTFLRFSGNLSFNTSLSSLTAPVIINNGNDSYSPSVNLTNGIVTINEEGIYSICYYGSNNNALPAAFIYFKFIVNNITSGVAQSIMYPTISESAGAIGICYDTTNKFSAGDQIQFQGRIVYNPGAPGPHNFNVMASIYRIK